MSGALSNVLAEVANVLVSVQRSIGFIIPDCTIEESHRDRATITQHPVEKGSPVADHMFLEPKQVLLHYGWSNGSWRNTLTPLGVIGLAPESYITDIYQSLVDLQASRRLFTLVTGKRLYENMQISDISVMTDKETEYVLMTHVTCEQLNIVKVQSVKLEKKDMKTPEKTAPTQENGTTQPTPTKPPPSVLHDIVPSSPTPSSGGLG